MTNVAERGKGLCLLSLDAGGSRAISQLRILSNLMERLNSESEGYQMGLPCTVFDMIGGTGSGGFIAILLVVFRLNARQALDEFTDLNDQTLEKSGMSAQARTAELKTYINNLLNRHKVAPDLPLLNPMVGSGACKLVVPISYKYDAGSTCTLRNFKVRHEQALDITISQALLVTLATPPLFTPISIFKDASTSEYIGGDLALSNPIQEIISEAHGAFGSEERVACLLSLGCGHPGVTATPNKLDLASWNQFLEQLISQSEKKAQLIDSQMGHLGIYYRFCVPIGLERSTPNVKKGPEEIIAHTDVYLEDVAVSQKVDVCIDFLKIRDGIPSLEQLKYSGGERILPPALPPLTNNFVMRQKPWEFIERTLLGANGTAQANGSRMLVVTGMGGCGKTQILLKFMRVHQEKFASQFFIDSSSKVRLRADIVRHVRSLGTEHSQKTFEDCLLFLAQPSPNGPRLILYDNVDDPNLELAPLLPHGKSCAIVITSRDRLIGGLCSKGHLELDVMSIDEAIDLLLHDTNNSTEIVTEQDRQEARDIAEALGCLPLALQQARSYMFQTKCSARTYLHRLSTSRDKLLSMALKYQLDSHSVSTYAAFDASFDKLVPRTQQALRLLSFFHWSSFPLELIVLAARYNFSDYETKYLGHGDDFDVGKVVLEDIFLRDGVWDVATLDEMTTSLQNYSLATLVPGVDTMLLQIHPLAHAWVRSCIPEDDRLRYQSAAVLLLSLGARTAHTPSARYLASHCTHMSGIWDRLEVNDAEAFALILSQGGSFEGALQLRERVVSELRTQIDPQSMAFSDSLWLLAVTYSDLGRFAEAEVLQAEVMNIRQSSLTEGDPTSLNASSSLANTYRRLRRFDEAEALQKEVLKVSKETLGEQHPDTMAALNNLALIYSDWGWFSEAEKLQVEALKLSKDMRGERHPDTLIASGDLANTYLNLGRPNEALPLQQEVVRLSKEIRGDRHPETSKAMSQLARIHSTLGYFPEAEMLQEDVLRLSKEMRGERHPVTIDASNGLATIYYDLGRFEEAGTLQEGVLRLRKEVLGERHLDTIAACGDLARIYFRLGRSDEAVWLQEETWRRRKELLGEGDPDAVAAATTLAHTFRDMGRRDESQNLLLRILNLTEDAVGSDHADYHTAWLNYAFTVDQPFEIHLQVLKWRRGNLGERHRDTILSMADVANWYQAQGRLWKAEKLQVEVVKLRKEILGDRHPDTIAACIDLALTYLSSSRPRKAERLQQEVVRILKETRGDRHPDTIRASGALAFIYYDLGRFREAEKLEEEVLTLQREVLGQNPPARIKSHIASGKLSKLSYDAWRLLLKGFFWADRLLVD